MCENEMQGKEELFTLLKQPKKMYLGQKGFGTGRADRLLDIDPDSEACERLGQSDTPGGL